MFKKVAIGLKDIDGVKVHEGDELVFAGQEGGESQLYHLRWLPDIAGYMVCFGAYSDSDTPMKVGFPGLVQFMQVVGSNYLDRARALQKIGK